jgi:hypothetical protein
VGWRALTEKLPKATHDGNLKIGELEISCAVLENGTRVLSERSTMAALGGKRGGSHWLRRKRDEGQPGLPVFVSAGNLAPFIPDELRSSLSEPVLFRARHGGRPAHGLPAEALPQICDVWLKARDAGALQASQAHIAAKADLLMRGLAHVGVIALVDEATGYQAERNRSELQQILEAYISKELLPWTKRFPDEFYEELFRLRGWTYNPVSAARPGVVGRLTNEIVYDRLPPGVVDELRAKNPVDPTTKRRKRKHHQFLTEDVGHPHLSNHLAAVVALMRAAPNWAAFDRMFKRAFPAPQLEMELGDDRDDLDAS